MKKTLISLFAAMMGVLAVASISLAATYNATSTAVANTALASGTGNTDTKEDILNSRHNFLASGDYAQIVFGIISGTVTRNASGTITVTTTSNQNAVQAQLCVFCHTPHGSNTGVANAPLWNRMNYAGTGTAATANKTYAANYTMYGSAVSGSSAFGSLSLNQTNNVGPLGVSQACLSCHDGVIGVDSALYNAPGFLGANSDRIHISADPAVFSGAGVDANELTSVAGIYGGGDVAFETTNGFFPGLGTDLSNDHPISIPYPVAGNVATGIDKQFRAITDNTGGRIYLAANSVGITGAYFAGLADTNAKNGVGFVQLYKSQPTDGKWYVECASCHNPHLGSVDKGSAQTYSTQFLRVTSKNSEICFTCHNK